MSDDRYAAGSRSYQEVEGPARGSKTNGFAIGALICGIVALLLSWIPGINLLAVLLGIVALILGFVGVGKAKDPAVAGGRGMAIAGIVTGLLALILAVLVYVGLFRLINDPAVQQRLEEAASEAQEQLTEGG